MSVWVATQPPSGITRLVTAMDRPSGSSMTLLSTPRSTKAAVPGSPLNFPT